MVEDVYDMVVHDPLEVGEVDEHAGLGGTVRVGGCALDRHI